MANNSKPSASFPNGKFFRFNKEVIPNLVRVILFVFSTDWPTAVDLGCSEVDILKRNPEQKNLGRMPPFIGMATQMRFSKIEVRVGADSIADKISFLSSLSVFFSST
jgi:hypothetical protein